MTELSEIWLGVQQGNWTHCPRYNIQITGCSRQVICKTSGLSGCYAFFPKQGINIAPISNRIKQIGFSIKQSTFSVKIAGV